MHKYTNLFFKLCLIIISVIFLFWLIAPLFFPDVWNGDFQEKDPDSLLFARLLEQSFLKGKVVENDNYSAFPYELNLGFAPFYLRFMYYTVTLIFTWFPSLQLDPMLVAACIPIVFPLLTSIIIIFAIYKITGNKILTLFCAFGMLPGFSWAMVGGFYKFDYDHIISFCIWCWLFGCALFIKTEKHYYAYIGSVVTALFISTWLGAPFFYGFVTFYGFVIWLLKKEKCYDYLDYSYVSMIIGGLVAILFANHSKFMINNLISGNVGRYSYLHGAIVVFGGGFLLFLRKISEKRNARIIGSMALIVSGCLIFAFKPEFFYEASGILLKKDPIHKTITELVSCLFPDGVFDDESWNLFYKRLGFFFLFCPLCFLGDWSKLKKNGFWLIRDWLGIFILLSIYQIRYIRWPGCGWGISTGIVLFFLWNLIKTGLSNLKYPIVRTCIVFLPVMLAVGITNYMLIGSKSGLGRTLTETLIWLRENTEKTNGYADENTPAYGVLSYWDLGNYISFYAKRPAVVSNSMWGYRTMAEVFSSRNEKESYELCKKYRIKYLLMQPLRYVGKRSFSYWTIFKNMPEDPVYRLYYKEVPLVEDSDKCFYTYLTQNLGLTSVGEFEPATRFRITYVSEDGGSGISSFLIYECIQGAEIVFNSKPDTSISLSIEIKLKGNNFIYKRKLNTDADGCCKFILPYSTSYNAGNVVTDDFYKVSFEDKDGNHQLASLVVPEANVISGEAVNLKEHLNYLSTSK